jgi:hypothetical protein
VSRNGSSLARVPPSSIAKSGVGQGLGDVVELEIWILAEDLVVSPSRGYETDHHAYGYPHATDAGFATHDARIACNAVECRHLVLPSDIVDDLV